MADSKTVFVDANVFIALVNTDDASHGRAEQLWRELVSDNTQLITSNLIIAEAITVLSQRANKKLALQFAGTVYGDDADIVVYYSNKTIEISALDILHSFKSKNVSFADAIILATMEKQGISRLVSFNTIFKQRKNISVLS